MVIKKTRTPRNKFEKRILRDLEKAKLNVKYESAKLSYLIAGHYTPDFVIQTPKGVLYIETKGHFRPDAKRKMVAVKKLHPTLDIRLLFYSYNKTNVRWCEKHGFPYAISDIPEEWFNEFRG